MLLILITNHDIFGEILAYCNQFDLNRLLRTCKTINQHPAIIRELTQLKIWCDARAEYMPVADNFDIVLLDVQTGLITGKTGKKIWESLCYKMYNTQTGLYSLEYSELGYHGENPHYYPKCKYNLQSNQVLIRKQNLRVTIVIKVEGDYKRFYAKPINNYCFTLSCNMF